MHRGVKTTVYNSHVVGVGDTAIFLFLKTIFKKLDKLKDQSDYMIPFHAEVEACVSI